MTTRYVPIPDPAPAPAEWAQAERMTRYAQSAAEGMLASLEHYGYHNPPCSDGRMGTPAWFANRLGKVLHYRGDTLPGEPLEWWGTRWEKYARQLLNPTANTTEETSC